MKSKLKSIIACLLFVLPNLIMAQNIGGLPVWPLSVASQNYLAAMDNLSWTNITNYTNDIHINWANPSGSQVDEIPGTAPLSGQDLEGSTQAGFNDCGDLVFYVIHAGSVLNQDALRLYLPNGTLLMGENTVPSAPNGALSDDEVQVVKRPGFQNQWYIIYRQAPISSGARNDWYFCAPIQYSVVEINNNVAHYVDILGVEQKNISLTIPSGSTPMYANGKAVSRTSVSIGANGHDLYLVRKYNSTVSTINSNQEVVVGAYANTVAGRGFIIDRFTIGNTGINWSAATPRVLSGCDSDTWGDVSKGSPLELSPDESKLAYNNRTLAGNCNSLFVFELNNGLGILNNQMTSYNLQSLTLLHDPNSAYNSTTQPNLLSISQAAATVGSLSFLSNFDRKITNIEFSFNGDYLYLTGGGYVSSSWSNLTYLAQVDLNNATVSLQIEATTNWNTVTTGRGVSFANWGTSTQRQANLMAFNRVARIQSCIDGNLYFTKKGVASLFVVPTPDNQMTCDLIPGVIDLSTTNAPNIPLNGIADFMPDQIDGYDYSGEGFQKVEIPVKYEMPGICGMVCGDTITVEIWDAREEVLVHTQTINGCEDTVRFCAEVEKDYTLRARTLDDEIDVASNGELIIDGDFIDLTGEVFTWSTIKFPVKYEEIDGCEMVCTGSINVEVWNPNTDSLIHSDSITNCVDELEFCIRDDASYHLIGSNGVMFLNAIQNGVLTLNELDFTGDRVGPLACCPILNGIPADDLIIFEENTTITQATMWDHKIYIADGVIVTIDGTTLDVTNTDVIFGNCAGIDFVNNATLRSTNSVYRPCEIDGIWRGLRFDVNPASPFYGFMNTSTIKNATVGMDIVGVDQDDFNIRITDNSFINCHNGVNLDNVHFLNSITGNNFNTTDLSPAFLQSTYETFCNVSYSTSATSGIIINECKMVGSISGNKFVRTNDGFSQNNNNIGFSHFYIGMMFRAEDKIANDVNAVVVNNVFENNTYGLFILYQKNLSIENNNFIYSSITSALNQPEGFNFGIAMKHSNNVSIVRNDFTNNADIAVASSFSKSKIGVSLKSSDIINVRENNFSNFEIGIKLNNVINSNVSNNELLDTWYYGLYIQDCFDNLNVSCNKIDNKLHLDRNTIGICQIDLTANTTATGNTIKSNCIYDTEVAIHMEGPNGQAGPTIANNFLYNYTRFGIEGIGVDLSSSLGTGLTSATAGKNTFVSNNIPLGAIDVASDLPVTVRGNSNMSTVGTGVTVVANNLFSSSASCAGQIGPVSNETNAHEVCDLLTGNETQYTPRSMEASLEEDEVETPRELATEIQQINSTLLEVYPVPAINQITFEIATELDGMQIEIYNAQGSMVEVVTDIPSYVKKTHDISEYSNGVYFVNLTNNGEVVKTSKFVKR